MGEKDTSNKSITERAAVLVFKALSNNYEDQKKIIRKIYDMRSKYVHMGEQTNPRYREYIEDICHQVLLCLLKLQKNTDNHCPGFIKKWLKNIDYVSKALEANKKIPDDELEEIGIEIE